MHINYLIFYGNLWYNLNIDSEHLYILREPPLATFTQLKFIPFLLRKYFGSLYINVLKVYIIYI